MEISKESPGKTKKPSHMYQWNFQPVLTLYNWERTVFFQQIVLEKLDIHIQNNEVVPLKECEVVQLCPTLCDPMVCSLPRSSIHGIFQARGLEWVAIYFSRGSFQPRDQTPVSRIVGRRFQLSSVQFSRSIMSDSL